MKNVFLKRVVTLVIVVFTMSLVVSAQEKGDMAVGANVVFGSGKGFSNTGIGAKFQYNVTNPIRLEGAFTYFFKKDFTSMWDFSVNANYLFPLGEKITIYPLVGVCVLGASLDTGATEFNEGGISVKVDGVSASSTNFGVNLGGGIDFNLTDKLFLNAEAKYKIVRDWDRFLVSVGVGYRF